MAGRVPWDQIKFRMQRRNIKTRAGPKHIEGFDTETEKGYARIAATSKAWREISSMSDVMEFLTQKENRSTLNVLWNLSYDVEALLKWDRTVISELAHSGCSTWEGWEIDYIPKKCLTVRDVSKHSYAYYDIAQFYLSSLAKASQEYLGELPHEFKGERATLFRDHSIGDIGAYCQDDANKTRRLGDVLVQGTKRVGLDSPKLYSCGYMAQEYALRYGDIPTLSCLPSPVARLYWEAYRGGWFDTYRRGRMRITSYDISSAYPWALCQLPDLRRGKWKRGIVEGAALGVADCTVEGFVETGQTLAVRVRGRNIYPAFDRKTRLALAFNELEHLKDTHDIRVNNAYSWVPNAPQTYPYREIVARLYEKKQASEKKSMEYMLYKRIMNSLYGKTCEVTKKRDGFYFGKLFNPCYAAEITSRVRMKMLDVVWPHRKHVVSILTDSVMFNKPVSLNVGKGLGEFEVQHDNEDCLVLQSGVYQFAGGIAASRGFSSRNNLFERCDTSARTIKVRTLRPLHYKECVRKKDFDRIAEFVWEEKELNLNADLKRIWPEQIKHARDLLDREYDSRPVPVSLLTP